MDERRLAHCSPPAAASNTPTPHPTPSPRLKDSVLAIVHQASLSCASYTDVAAYARTALIRLTDDRRWCAVAARGAYLHIRAVKGTQAALLVPCLASELLPVPGGTATPLAVPPAARFSVLVFQCMAVRDGLMPVQTVSPPPSAEANGDPLSSDDDAAGSTAVPTIVAAAPTSLAALTSCTEPSRPPLRGVLDATTTTMSAAASALIAGVVGGLQAARGLHNDSEAAVAAALKSTLEAQQGGLWHVLLASSPLGGGKQPPAAATSSRAVASAPIAPHAPGLSLTDEPACRFDLTTDAYVPPGVTLSARSAELTPPRYHVCLFRSSPGGAAVGSGSAALAGGPFAAFFSAGELPGASTGVRGYLRWGWAHAWTLGRILCYTVAAAAFFAYFVLTYSSDNHCAPSGSGGVGAGRRLAEILGLRGQGAVPPNLTLGLAEEGLVEGAVGLLPNASAAADEFNTAPPPPPDLSPRRDLADGRAARTAWVDVLYGVLARVLPFLPPVSPAVSSAGQGAASSASWGHFVPVGAPPPGCSARDAEAAGLRLSRAQVCLYTAIGAVGLLSLLRTLQKQAEAARLAAVLKATSRMLAGGGEGGGAGGGGGARPDKVAGGGKGQGGKAKRH